MEISRKAAVVTGGASRPGLGRTTAQQLIKHGAKVVVNDLPNSSGTRVAKGIGGAAFAPDNFKMPMRARVNREAAGCSIPNPPHLGRPSEYALLAGHIIENSPLDGALRMASR